MKRLRLWAWRTLAFALVTLVSIIFVIGAALFAAGDCAMGLVHRPFVLRTLRRLGLGGGAKS